MRKVAVDCSLARWQRLLLALGVLVAAWGPAHSVELAAVDRSVEHDVEDVAQARSPGSPAVGSPAVAPTVPGALASFGGVRGADRGSGDDHRCGHHDAERDATQATAVRQPQPDVMSGLSATARDDGEPRRALADIGESRAPPGQLLVVMLCVWRQ